MQRKKERSRYADIYIFRRNLAEEIRSCSGKSAIVLDHTEWHEFLINVQIYLFVIVT
jgi:hypothetical protein